VSSSDLTGRGTKEGLASNNAVAVGKGKRRWGGMLTVRERGTELKREIHESGEPFERILSTKEKTERAPAGK